MGKANLPHSLTDADWNRQEQEIPISRDSSLPSRRHGSMAKFDRRMQRMLHRSIPELPSEISHRSLGEQRDRHCLRLRAVNLLMCSIWQSARRHPSANRQRQR